MNEQKVKMEEQRLNNKLMELDYEYSKVLNPIFVKSEKQQIVRRNIETLNQILKTPNLDSRVREEATFKILNFLDKLE
ncbi:MAG: hypothetical protein ACOCT9_00885 [archaeon]